MQFIQTYTSKSYEIEILEFVLQVIFHPSCHGMQDKINIWENGRYFSYFLQLTFTSQMKKNQDPPEPFTRKTNKKIKKKTQPGPGRKCAPQTVTFNGCRWHSPSLRVEKLAPKLEAPTRWCPRNKVVVRKIMYGVMISQGPFFEWPKIIWVSMGVKLHPKNC